MRPNLRNGLLILGSLLAIAGSWAWIYCRDIKTPPHNVPLHQRIGEIMAEQTARIVGPKGRLVVLTIPAANQPELLTQLQAFRRRLKTLGAYEVKERELDTKDQPKYGLGAGLSGRRYLRAVKNNPKADAIVSFIGTPKLSDEETAGLQHAPRFIAETRSIDHLPVLFEKKLIQIAIAPRFAFPAPGPQRPKTPQEWFDKRYQIVAFDSVGELKTAETQ